VTKGEEAERLVIVRLRAALPKDYRVFGNVAWLERTADNRGLRDGEADVVVAHPDRGFLVIEVKAGEIARDAHGRWFAGTKPLNPNPFEQARTSIHALLRKLDDLPDRPSDFRPIAGHAVAFPDVDLASAGNKLRLLGPDVEPNLLFDRAKLPADDPARTREAVDTALAMWAGDGGARRAPGAAGIALLEELLETPVALRSLLKSEIVEGEREVLGLTQHQIETFRRLGRNRRMSIAGAAGTGKTMLAAEKARQLAREGFDTLLVCFNQPLARLLREETADIAERTGRLTVSTFHQLCEDLGREAGTLPPKSSPIPQSWWEETLPDALDEAIVELGPRFHAVVVDEGQDFDAEWLVSLDELLHAPGEDVLYVFHDPAQAIYREDVVETLKLMTYDLDENCRNPGPIHRFAIGYATGAPDTVALREDGRAPEVIEAEPGKPTLDALASVLHRLRVEEGVRPWEIAVLVGGSLEGSVVWQQRRFGNEVLWNGQVDDTGRTVGLAAADVPEQPGDVIVCDSIRRFKGLEKPVVILVELSPEDKRLAKLLYIGASRAKQHLVVIAPPGVLS
jgi:hypothetical protein